MPSLGKSLGGVNVDPQTATNTAAITALQTGKADALQAVNLQTGTTYTLQASDVGKLVRITNAAAITLTVPDTFSVGAGLSALTNVEQGGAGQITVVGSGTRVMAANGLTNKTRGATGAEIALRIEGTTYCKVLGDAAVV